MNQMACRKKTNKIYLKIGAGTFYLPIQGHNLILKCSKESNN